MSNREKLQAMLVSVFLLEESEFSFARQRGEVDTWDSLGVVALAVGIEESFGYHCRPEEANALRSFQDVLELLERKGISFVE